MFTWEEIEKAVQSGWLNLDRMYRKENTIRREEIDFPIVQYPKGGSTVRTGPQVNTRNANHNYPRNQLEELRTQLKKVVEITTRMEAKMDNQGTRTDKLEKRARTNQQGIMVLFDSVQQIANALLGKKNKPLLQKLSQKIDTLKDEFIEQCKVFSPEQPSTTTTTPTPPQMVVEKSLSLMTASNTDYITRMDEHQIEIATSIPSSDPSSHVDVKGTVIQKVIDWGFPDKEVKKIEGIVNEWFLGLTLNRILSIWEEKKTPSVGLKCPLNILTYNVQRWETRALEAIDLIYRTDSSIGIFTEVGELWNSMTVHHFNTFYQKGTNNKSGVMIVVGKHLEVTRINLNTENTVTVDVDGLSEPVRVIGIYWPQCQQRKLHELVPYIAKGTIVTEDFNTTVQEWGSPITDVSGASLKRWIETIKLRFIPGTKNSSKRSARHIDLIFINIHDATLETLLAGSSDH